MEYIVETGRIFFGTDTRTISGLPPLSLTIPELKTSCQAGKLIHSEWRVTGHHHGHQRGHVHQSQCPPL